MTINKNQITEEQVQKGQAVYSIKVLNVYDILVLGVSNRWIWQCPTPILLDWFNEHVSSQHLDIGVGTGYFLDHCRFPTTPPKLTLMDLNPNTLNYANGRLARYQPQLIEHDVFQTLSDVPKALFDSVSINYLLHCLPGDMPAKAVVFDHVLPLLSGNGVLFGSTILQGGVTRNGAAKRLMALYNKKGIFSNTQDSLESLKSELQARFSNVRIEITGCVARFAAYV